MSRLDRALDHARRGFVVLPVYPIRDRLCACPKRERCEHPGKHPLGHLVPNGRNDATRDEATIRKWWRGRWADANLGIATGPESGMFVVDVDPRHGGEETLAQCEREHGELPPTWESLTGGGGRHLWFRWPPSGEVASRNGALGPGLDMKARGGYVVAPGSGHVSGGVYEWAAAHHPDEIPLADAPAWLLALTVAPPATGDGSRAPFSMPEQIHAGVRNDTLYRLARSLRARGLTAGAILAALEKENAARCRPPLSAGELADIVAGAMKQSDTPAFKAGRVENPAAAADDALTDLTNAQRFVHQHGGRIRHVFAWHRDLIFDSRRWATDPGEGMLLDAGQTARALYNEAAQATSEARRQELARHAARSSNIHRLQAMMTLARAELACARRNWTATRGPSMS